ncbi:DUF2480 family protein [Flavihumibacter sp. CACIAM 22H1]|uniref:DUF2480 family protein n=1 Tax=Flavihumibacter sp. CACIAM 22H1 TaxID=1812911 RepID=UPI0007A933A7|nr:DUF2480 family protein [Flavihumibacter sp. CACIAM 22H1]KYP15796.1 MAG: hypothetical protein A1D16_05535 [Flavihumibacter sp. CACIAM 22H1]
MSEPITNKIAESGLITLDLETYYPKEEILQFDLATYLFMGLILKEKEFRAAMKEQDWDVYRGKLVAVSCTADAIIPMWAYMLVASYLQPVAAAIYQGTEAEFRKKLFLDRLNEIEGSSFVDQRVVIKGCGDLPLGEYAYFEISRILLPQVRSLMYGEPCSTVPVFKRQTGVRTPS